MNCNIDINLKLFIFFLIYILTKIKKTNKKYIFFRTESEARSYNETLIHQSTKTLQKCYDKQSTQMNNDVIFFSFYFVYK